MSAQTNTMPTRHNPVSPSRLWLGKLFSAGLLLATGVLLIALLGVAQRIGWIQSAQVSSNSTGQAAEQIFTCPMHPQIRQPGPGRCPICGMALVPASTSTSNIDEFAVNIEPTQRRLANIQTAELTLQPVSTTIRTIGAIQIDESRQATISSYISGRVERLFADYTGVDIDKGDHLAIVYSPELYGAQIEFLKAREASSKLSGGALQSVQRIHAQLVENSRQRLVELGMTKDQLAKIELSGVAESRLTIHAPMGGTVIQKLAEEGKYIEAGEPIYRIANLSTLWLMLELYPEDARRIRFGQIVEGELQSLPGEQLTGRVAFVDRIVNQSTRTVGVRVEFDNSTRRIRPGDYARATIKVPIGPQGKIYDAELAGKWISPMHPQIVTDKPGDCPICGMKLVPTSRYGYSNSPVEQPESLTAPRSAVLLAGDQSVVYVETEPGRFEIRVVTLGPILKNRVIILGGAKAGEKVATAGNFLIDSQMQLAGNPSLIDPTRAIAHQVRNTPLQFTSITIATISGVHGEKLEELYALYFKLHESLAHDQVPLGPDVEALNARATELISSPFLSAQAQLLIEIGDHSKHLHHLSLNESRKQFKQVSHRIVTLATQVRGSTTALEFRQFFCPMVDRGEGDWLQGDDELLNPYFGSSMLRCGELVRVLPRSTIPENKSTTPRSDTDQAQKHEED